MTDPDAPHLLTQDELDQLLRTAYARWNEHQATRGDGPGARQDRPNLQVDGQATPDGIVVVSITGRSLSADVSTLIGEVTTLLAEADGHLVLDLQGCDYLSSFAVGALAELADRRRARDRRVVLVRVNRTVDRVLGIMGLRDAFPTYPDVDTALTALRDAS